MACFNKLADWVYWFSRRHAAARLWVSLWALSIAGDFGDLSLGKGLGVTSDIWHTSFDYDPRNSTHFAGIFGYFTPLFIFILTSN
jgi:hypothetical protein